MARVLVVDDEKSIRITLREFLKDADYEVAVAEDADQAMEMLAAEDFDVTVTDIILPRVTGVDLLKAIKEISPHVQVILMTGEPTVETASEAVRAGAFDYLAKPIDKEHFLRTVANAAKVKVLDDERRRLVKENRQYQDNLEQLVKKRTTALRKSEQKYRLLADNATDIIWTTDENFKFTYISPSVERILGFTAAEVVVKPLAELVTPHSFKQTTTLLQEEMRLGKKGDYPEGKTMTAEIELMCKDGSTMCAEVAMRLLFDSEKNPIGVLGISRDITERRRVEEEKAQLEDEFQQAQKIESIGRLAAGVAHDFNNMLGIILGYGENLLEQLHHGDPLQEDAKEIVAAGRRSAALTRQLLAFSRRQRLQPEVLDLNAVVQNIEKMLGRVIGEDIELILRPSKDLVAVLADPGQMEQVIVNLAINARDAMPRGGKMIIETANVELDQADAQDPANLTPGTYAMLAVTDTGCGMDKETLSHIFEPFFTTKEEGRGTGLGLSTVHGIVKQSSGDIRVHSAPGQGTTFKIYLPRTDAEQEKKETPEKEELGGGGEHILVVEDQAALRTLLEKMLSRFNYRVSVAANGGEALLLVEERGWTPDLVITDVIMPGMNGAVLAERLQRNKPDLKVLYMSGYTDDVILERGTLEPDMPFIQKPFDGPTLAAKVRAVLRG
ncbi:MAG: response regulator [Proteobacteria bacterium]|nr:response regulator [Pseudomonadota bacterium]